MDINAKGDVSIGADVVGRDKITHIHQYGEKKERPIPRMAPPAPRVFIGREGVLRELIAALKLGEDGAGPIALIALKGMGGIGKTTLAAALANHPEVETALPEGTLWAGLGPEPEVMSLLAEWGTQLGEDFAQFDSPEKRSRRLSTLLHDKKVLLVVDDVWQAEAASYFRVGGPRCRTLITTRDNEIARKLAGHEAIRVETLTNAASLNLLRELAPEAVEADEKAANELATVLDGLPLAITLAGQMLAAEWEAGLGVAGALSELKDREARLKLAGAEKRPGLATTEPSLRAILAMSYDRLPDEATKRAFRLLGVFSGKPLTFSIDAAAAMWEMELRPAQKTMVALVGRALVEPVDGGRYTLHTTLADFAESLLEEHGEAVLALETHANYYLEFARKNAEKNWQAVEMEMGQIRRGFQSADRLTDKLMVLAYYRAMSIFFNRRGLWNEWMQWAKHALSPAQSLNDRSTEAKLFNDIGYIHNRKGAWNEAMGYCQRSQAIYEEIGDRAGLAQSLHYIGIIYYNKGLWDEALEYQERSRAIYEEIGDRAGLAYSLNHIGYICNKKGLWDEALGHYERSHAIREEIGDRTGLAVTLQSIGGIYKNKGLWNEALQYYDRSRGIREEVGERVGLAWALKNIGDVYEKQTRLADAEQVLTQAVAIFEELGSPEFDNARKQLDKVRELQRIASQK
ncbi:tetratricopeptide repeat protein [candidate division KSB1 bacterium]|nr:tetratricopeptide repeat protein [candidate division KSB1 bacterium]